MIYGSFVMNSNKMFYGNFLLLQITFIISSTRSHMNKLVLEIKLGFSAFISNIDICKCFPIFFQNAILTQFQFFRMRIGEIYWLIRLHNFNLLSFSFRFYPGSFKIMALMSIFCKKKTSIKFKSSFHSLRLSH